MTLYFSFNPEAFSQTTVCIGGIQTYIYGLSRLAKGAEKASCGSPRLAILLYLIHGRGETHEASQSVGFQLMSTWYASHSTPLVVVTMDNPNHGTRLVDDRTNLAWNKGNENHAMDMVAMIDATANDYGMIMDHTPAYLSTLVPCEGVEFRTVLSGISLGGHATIRLAQRYPNLDAIIPIIGCTDLSSLLLNRLRKTYRAEHAHLAATGLYTHTYAELGLSAADCKRYPRRFHEYLAAQDLRVMEAFGNTTTKKLFLFGGDDRLVPPAISNPWLDRHEAETIVFDGVGHTVTEAMVNAMSECLANL